MVIMSGCSSVTRSFNSSCLFVMLLIFSCRSVKSFLLWCDVVAWASGAPRGDVYICDGVNFFVGYV